MIYLSIIIWALCILIWGIVIGVKLSEAVLNKNKFDKDAKQAVDEAFRTASCIKVLLDDYMFKFLKECEKFPYKSLLSDEMIRRKINLN